MFVSDESGLVQLNVRVPEPVLAAVNQAAQKSGKSVTDFVRLAVLVAACHQHRGASPTVYLDPREGVTIEEARELGFVPVTDEESETWKGEVRVEIDGNGLCRDAFRGLWVLTPSGLKSLFRNETPAEVPSKEGIRRTILSALEGAPKTTRALYEILKHANLGPGSYAAVRGGYLKPMAREGVIVLVEELPKGEGGGLWALPAKNDTK